MSMITLYLIVFAGGLALAVQPAINGTLAGRTGTIESALVSFTVGTIALLIIVLLAGKGDMKAITDAPAWELSGGLIGAFFVVVVTYVVPRTGVTSSMMILVAAQITAGIVIDHYGLLGMQQIPVDIKKTAGICLLVAGVFLAG